MEAKYCYCSGWQENIELLQTYFQFGEEFGYIESIETFEYCPWCGSKLFTINELGEEINGGDRE